MKNGYITALLMLLLSTTAHAKLNGKNVVLVHGLQTSHLGQALDDAGLQRDANEYWNKYWGQRSEAILYWSATDRVAGGIKDDMHTQIKQLEAQGLCRDGCVFVTHSTGDLVLRDALSRLNQWGVNASDFRVIATLDFAGAGGGSELADLAVNITEGGGLVNSAARGAVNLFLGFTPTSNNIGVLHDLRPNAARQIATQNAATPRLRFAGAGSAFLRATKVFLPGSDDAVVAMHSACGSRYKSSYDSCSRSVRSNGAIRSADGPSSFYYNHYPVIMGDDTDHFEAITNDRTGYMTPVVNGVTQGLHLDFSTYVKRRFLLSNLLRVRDSDGKSMSANVYDTLNR